MNVQLKSLPDTDSSVSLSISISLSVCVAHKYTRRQLQVRLLLLENKKYFSLIAASIDALRDESNFSSYAWQFNKLLLRAV